MTIDAVMPAIGGRPDRVEASARYLRSRMREYA